MQEERERPTLDFENGVFHFPRYLQTEDLQAFSLGDTDLAVRLKLAFKLPEPDGTFRQDPMFEVADLLGVFRGVDRPASWIAIQEERRILRWRDQLAKASSDLDVLPGWFLDRVGRYEFAFRAACRRRGAGRYDSSSQESVPARGSVHLQAAGLTAFFFCKWREKVRAPSQHHRGTRSGRREGGNVVTARKCSMKRWTVLIGAAAMVLVLAPATPATGASAQTKPTVERPRPSVTCPCQPEPARTPVQLEVREPDGKFTVSPARIIRNSTCRMAPGGLTCFLGGEKCEWIIVEGVWIC